ncbi:MAG: DNA polymerase III subunit epsilon [Pseudomonadota bacterium]
MREIVLDTETTGLYPAQGHRIVEIGCVELINHVATERHFHQYINPERPMDADAEAVHGLTDAFLSDKPVFAEIADDFLTFVGDSPLVIHNAAFDIGFLNAELGRLGYPDLPMERAVDTVKIARRRFPGAQASLDALCRRYGIDLTDRALHGALLDSNLLARVYLELRGGRQPGLVLGTEKSAVEAGPVTVPETTRQPRAHAASPEEEAAHAAFLEKLTNPIWHQAKSE